MPASLKTLGVTVAIGVLAPVAATAKSSVTYRAFVMPSHQIVCGILLGSQPEPHGGQLRCDLRFQNDRAVFLAITGKAKLVHVTDAIANPNTAPRLDYGTTRTYGPFTCTSKVTGLYCHNRHRHGFSVSQQFQRVY